MNNIGNSCLELSSSNHQLQTLIVQSMQSFYERVVFIVTVMGRHCSLFFSFSASEHQKHVGMDCRMESKQSFLNLTTMQLNDTGPYEIHDEDGHLALPYRRYDRMSYITL